MKKKMWKKKLNKKQGKQLIYNMHNNEIFLNKNEKNIVFFFNKSRLSNVEYSNLNTCTKQECERENN
jgi:hypothetical protein